MELMPFDHIYNTCLFLHYRDLISFCTINKRFLQMYKMHPKLYENQLKIFKSFMCPILWYSGTDTLLNYTFKLRNHSQKYGYNDKYYDILNDFNQHINSKNCLLGYDELDTYNKSRSEVDEYLRIIKRKRDQTLNKQPNTFNKRGIMPYIDNNVYIENYILENSDDQKIKSCIIPRKSDILLYTDIISTSAFSTLFKSARIDVGDYTWYKTSVCRQIDEKTFRLCWNVQYLEPNEEKDINQDSGIDKDMLWIILIQLHYSPVKIFVELSDHIECTLKVHVIYHASMWNCMGNYITPHMTTNDYVGPHSQYFDCYANGIGAWY